MLTAFGVSSRCPGSGEGASMSRFYFHLYDEHDTVDAEGMELPDAEAAEAHGFATARLMAAQEIIASGQLHLGHGLVVTDEDDAVVRTIAYGEAVELFG
jgi:hypothetical protein